MKHEFFDLADLYDLEGFTDEQYESLQRERVATYMLMSMVFTQQVFDCVEAYVNAGFRCTQDVIAESGKSKTGCINLLKTAGVYQTEDKDGWKNLIFIMRSFIDNLDIQLKGGV